MRPGPSSTSRLLCAWVLAIGAGSGAAQAPGGAAWFDGGRPAPQATQAVELLAAAASHGLAPQDYGVAALAQALATAARAPPDAATQASVARTLDGAMQRYLQDLHHGRIDPRQGPHRYAPPRRAAFNAAATLQAALAARRLGDAVHEAAPPLPLYGQLRGALARYRELGDHPAWQQPLPAPPRGKLEPGQPYAGLAVLTDRLHALGDLPPEAPGEPAPQAPGPLAYEGALVDALRGFQRRHALADDGVLGRATLAKLQIGPAARARQIELMLERLRWTPLMQAPRMIVINIPEFVLRAYEVQDGRIRLREQMKVIVGKAMDTRTPLFDEDMRAIEFSPYWNVPPSIARNELVPRLRRDPGHFEREGFEFVGAAGAPDTGLSEDRLDAVLAGRLRIRQRPGPRNALGDIKFVFPNRSNIYLHHTPSLRLFERERRDFSHGCIRVEQPLALARFVLQPQPDWTEARIRHAMSGGQAVTLRLAEPVPVVIAYGTALVKDGKLHFFEDLYGHDRALDAALRQYSRNRPPLP